MIITNIQPQFLIHMPVGGEWIIILIAIIVLFGGKKIPELARGIGKGIREFNDAKEGVKGEIEKGIREKEVAQNTTATTNVSAPTTTTTSTPIPTSNNV